MYISKLSYFQNSNLNFNSKIKPKEQNTTEAILSAMELAASSRAAETKNLDNTPHFFDLNLKNFLSQYEITKGLSYGFYDKLSKQKRFKIALRTIEAGINAEYCEIAKINFTTRPAQISKKIQSDVLQNMYYLKTVQSNINNPILIHIFANREGNRKAYLKTTPDNQIIELITSKVASKGEEKDSLYAFDASGKLAYFEEVQEDNSTRTLSFDENKIIAKEKDSLNKLTSKRKFEYNNGSFKEIN